MKTTGLLIICLITSLLLTIKPATYVNAQTDNSAPSLTWERIDVGEMPSPRYGFSITLNSTNQVAMFFGGRDYEGEFLNDLWLTDGRQWLQFSTPNRPQGRLYSSFVYDPNHSEAILFGGGSTNGPEWMVFLNDTWTFDGTDWHEQLPSSSPSPRINSSTVYDPDHQRVFLFGGTYYSDKARELYNDTWVWDGSNWQELSTPTKPGARSNAAMAYDPIHHNIVLFGGENYASYWSDTWIWDGAQWVEQHPAHHPDEFYFDYPQMAYDASRQQIIMIGSLRQYGDGGRHTTQTWAWDGVDWILLEVKTPFPQELIYGGKLIYLPTMNTVAFVNTFHQKFPNPDDTFTMVDRSEVWALVNRYFEYVPFLSQ